MLGTNIRKFRVLGTTRSCEHSHLAMQWIPCKTSKIKSTFRVHMMTYNKEWTAAALTSHGKTGIKIIQDAVPLQTQHYVTPQRSAVRRQGQLQSCSHRAGEHWVSCSKTSQQGRFLLPLRLNPVLRGGIHSYFNSYCNSWWSFFFLFFLTLALVEVKLMVSVMLIPDFHLFTLPQTHKEGICLLFGAGTNAALLTFNHCCNVCWEKNNKGGETGSHKFSFFLGNQSSQRWNKTFHHLPTSGCPDNIYNVLFCRGQLPKCPPVSEECCAENRR